MSNIENFFNRDIFFYHDYSIFNESSVMKELVDFFGDIPVEKLKTMTAPVGEYEGHKLIAQSKEFETVEELKSSLSKIIEDGTLFLYQFFTVLIMDSANPANKRYTYKVRYDYIRDNE